ncbi:YdcF family protein [uncultured Ferrovibrio sp.]|jgi:uncharacterized SAM-binding protein YcdF (DUF218 family)|uniref:YdcF family protein n=1 Tax=uncultured Ferrovibrio sp. TaxID=1576913 RepID=UPI00262AA8E7|nr:YdcF family protein [uncultured Ferrovibrio sp.]
MIVYLGKILWWLASPANLPFTLAIVALLLICWRRSRVLGRRLGIAALGLLLVLGFLPVGDAVLRPLEEYFPPQPLPNKVDGIILLGGSEEVEIGEFRGQGELNNAGDRYVAFAALAWQFPEARLVYTGGGVDWGRTKINETHIARDVLAKLGLDLQRVLFDDKSRNTAENAIYAKALAQPKPGETWLLVTSAMHMPRSINCFLAVDWPVIPHVVDYRTGRFFSEFKPAVNLLLLDGAVREWIGLIAYRLLGHTRTILPPRVQTSEKAANVAPQGFAAAAV